MLSLKFYLFQILYICQCSGLQWICAHDNEIAGSNLSWDMDILQHFPSVIANNVCQFSWL